MTNFDSLGWRAASDRTERLFEAADFFTKSRKGSPIAQATLQEAFSTSDFPVLLGAAFEQQAIAAQKAAVFEFDGVLAHATRPDFTRGKLVDLWENNAFERVNEGEEYKGGTFSETSLTHGTAKWGKSYGLTFELQLRRAFSDLANFPRVLGSGATRARNAAVASTLVTDAGAWNTDLFGTPATDALDVDGLTKALNALAQREDHRGELVDTSDLVLIVGPALEQQAQRLTGLSTIETTTTSGGKSVKSIETNPFAGRVKVLVARSVGKRLADQTKSWAIVQGSGSDLPSLIETGLEGHDGNVDIRVKRDQGQSIGGGDVPVNEGSFNDDTIWYRGRTFFGIDRGFGEGAYASTGAGA